MNFIELKEIGVITNITFKKKIEDLEGYAEGGMKANILKLTSSHDGILVFTVDYSGFEDYNRNLETANYWLPDGSLGTAREAGMYNPTETLHVMESDIVEDYLTIDSSDRFDLYQKYKEYNSDKPYVTWLEDLLIEQMYNFKKV